MAMTEQEQEEIIKLVALCENDPLKYAQVFYPWGEGMLEGSTGPREWQANILGKIRDHLGNKKTRYNPCRIAVASGHGIGKAHPNSLMLHTPNGYVRWGDLKEGDTVFGSNGLPTIIKKIHRRGKLQTYRVTFHDGSSTLVCADHLWRVKGRNQRRTASDWITLSTKEIIDRGIKRKNGKAIARQWEIPIQSAVQFSRHEVPIAPYLLGVWLGDGGRTRPSFTSNDSEVINKIQELGYSIHFGKKQKTEALSCYVHDIKEDLENIGVLDKYSYQKSVPVLYMENDIETRSEILRGLLDTDGEVGKQGTIGFSSCSYALARDVVWLVRSLGGKAQFQPTVKKPFFNDADGNKKAGRDCWRLSIQMPEGFRSFYIERKQARVKKVENRYLNRWIDKIEKEEFEECQCITVDAEDHLYLTNDFIVTHNSCLIAMIVDWAMKMPDTKIVVTASTDKQLKTKTFPELEKWQRVSLTKDWFKVTATSIASLDPDHERTWRADAIPWDDDNTESFQGMHNKGKRIVLVFDEGSAISDKIYEVAEGALTDEDTQIIWLVFGNPTRGTGRFRECFGRFKNRWTTFQIDSRTVEGTNKAELQEQVDAYGEDSDFVRVRVRGEFPRAGNMQFIAGDIVDKARKRDPYHKAGDPRIMGVDVSRYGDDESVIAKRVGRDAASSSWVTLRNVDTMSLAARVVKEAEEFKPDAIFVDGGGVGGGVIDRLNMLRMPVIEVQFGAKSDNTNPERESQIIYADKAAEIWGAMNDWLRGGSIPDDPALEMQLTGREYGFVLKEGKDAIKLEKKSDMKKRGLDSPDRADALALTFSYAVQGSDHTAVLKPGGKTMHTADYDPLDFKKIREGSY